MRKLVIVGMLFVTCATQLIGDCVLDEHTMQNSIHKKGYGNGECTIKMVKETRAVLIDERNKPISIMLKKGENTFNAKGYYKLIILSKSS